ncbi:DEAD/DEAH box helicase [Kribbella sp. NPDC049227]|uniref:DEAD/DEAH box helicase n=1 Tax=Kribbella sp. NPDC049227 TaxID=3364113 RepID=UPI00371FE8C4
MTAADGPVLERVRALTLDALATYAVSPRRVEEDANGERRIHQGGYGDRQLFELIQNAADELVAPADHGGRIHAILTADNLYCANEGAPITADGAETILRMGVSKKRGGQIGRFGVGVKSVLSVTRAPQFFSRSGAFGFDADWSTTEILHAVNHGGLTRGEPPFERLDEVPVLRLARPLDEQSERAADPILDDLLQWATTVVRLPLLPGCAAALSCDIHQSPGRHDRTVREFPHLFQLFSNHVGTVLLDDRRVMPTVRREITLTHDGVNHTIHESRSGAKAITEQHRVFVRAHQVSDASRVLAGELHARGTIDVSWAVPEYHLVRSESGRVVFQVPNERGVFWSFFPTKYSTTLSGALNAAWKTNEDRQNLLDSSSLNSELLDVAAALIVDSLPELVVPEDPAAYLPLLPGRSKESPNWACAYLTEEVWKRAACSPSLPDQDGRLCMPTKLRIHPERLGSAVLSLWRAYPERPRDWVHHSVDSQPIRRGKMHHILEAASHREPESIRAWLEALVEDESPAASAAAIRVLSHLLDHELAPVDAAHQALADEARMARIVLTEEHGLVAAVPGRVFRRTAEDGLRDDLTYVDQQIAGDPTMLRHLDRLAIRDADNQGRFHSVLDQGFKGYTDDSWSRFWELVRVAGGTSQTSVIRSKVSDPAMTIRVKTMAGVFRPMKHCLLPGPVVPSDGSRDARLTVDIAFHTDDLSVLRELGMTDRPTTGYRPEEDDWFADYHRDAYDTYCGELESTASRVQLHTVRLEGSPTAGPLHLFIDLSDEGKAAFLATMPEDGLVENWTRQIGRSVNTRTAVESPIRWLLRGHGTVKTSKGLTPTVDAVGPQLADYAAVLPVAEISAIKARRLGLPDRAEQVGPERWSNLLEMAKTSTDDTFVGRTYALLIRVAPDVVNAEVDVRCRVGDGWEQRPDSDIAVAFTQDQYAELIRERHPALLVSAAEDIEQAEYMIREWGMRRVAEVVERRVRYVASGPGVLLTDEYPPLRQLFGTRVAGLQLQHCSELEEVVRTADGTRTATLRAVRQESTLLVVDGASHDETLALADQEFGWLLGPDGCRRLIDAQLRQEQDQVMQARVRSIRASDSVIEKIALLIDAEDLRNGLPDGLVDSEIAETGHEPDGRRLAEMAYNAHDDSILRVHSKDIAALFPKAPSRFDGGSSALGFVASLGFPDTFAGASIPSLPMRLEAEGPTEFPGLHDYQELISTRLTALLRQNTPQRAMLSLPTGAGKTRVASEGVIRWIRESGVPTGPIVWIAQTNELCEQAVQSWKFVWEKVGPKQPLVIDRLWHSNSATPVSSRPHLVVATDAKLRVCLATEEYRWLRDASLVLVDEAHVAISPTYTMILEHLGLTHRESRCHLIGLTATPYRNDVDLTRRLVQRFGDRRLDDGIFAGEPIPSLQQLGVLSQVEHRELVGAEMQLSTDELATVAEFNGFLPKGAEQRLAENEKRNHLLIEEISALPSDWPVLVFATSVQHAKFLAAKLGDRGIRAAAIDSATPAAERRQRVNAFRDGSIRVITNYGVLSQGFDAPATRAVVIARPVFSANIYQQMVGRGLRGLRNGGKDSCLILDVRDNITNFHKELAFNEFEHLWDGSAL